MRIVAQRVTAARVEVAGRVIAAIGPGLLLFVGVAPDDGEADIVWLAAKIARLRIFDDAAGVMNRSVLESGGALLAVSQFTLFAAVKKGNRPSWSGAAAPPISAPLFVRFVARLEAELGRAVPSGRFGADMQVHLVNDGPVTIFLDSKNPQ